MTPQALYLNLHPETCNPTAQWDQMHILKAVRDLGLTWGEANHVPGGEPPRVVLISGQHHTSPEDVERINRALPRWDPLTVILHSDEASLFPWWEIDRPGIQWWISTPRRSVHGILATRDTPDGPTRFFGEGAGPPVSLPPVAKDLDVYFGGQVTHKRRQELADVLRPLQSERIVLEVTDGFMRGRARPGYLTMLARARVAPCPSGPGTVDSFRMAEALSVGCIPVVERFTPDGVDHGTLQMQWPDGFPFPQVDSWSELPARLPHILADFDRIAADCADWWRDRQADLVRWLAEDTAPPA